MISENNKKIIKSLIKKVKIDLAFSVMLPISMVHTKKLA